MKWLLLTVALLLVIAIAVGATLLFTRDGDNPPTAAPPTSTTPAVTGDVASANDTGPVSVITEDPTCDPWRPIIASLSDAEQNGWDRRDSSAPATVWSQAQKDQFDTVAEAMRSAADQTVALVRLTPHRVMRELYEQTIAYLRAYADAVPTYTAIDDNLAVVANSSAAAINSICSAIAYRSAQTRGPLAGQAPPPSGVAAPGDPAAPVRFLLPPANPVCPHWTAASSQFLEDTAAWRNTDPMLPANEWTTEQRLINDQVAGVMLGFADKLQQLGRRSNNSTWEDFAFLSAQYRRAYVLSLASYTPHDNFLSQSASQLVFVVNRACAATGA